MDSAPIEKRSAGFSGLPFQLFGFRNNLTFLLISRRSKIRILVNRLSEEKFPPRKRNPNTL